MNETVKIAACWPEASRNDLRAAYPNRHQKLSHTLDKHPLLELESLARLAESMSDKMVEYNKGALPIGIKAEDVPENGLSIGETIRRIDEVGSWAVLKHIEQDPAYKDLLDSLLGELKDVVEGATGPMKKPEGYIFISSPDAVTPFHFDPEHNILMQLRGDKVFHVFPAGDDRFAAHEEHERYHGGGHRNLPWQDSFSDEGEAVHLTPGDAIYVPVMAPHFVKNGSAPSVSLSITWRSRWSMDEANAYAFNKRLRGLGLSPTPPARFPEQNRARSIGERVFRKIGK
ncbi:cupin-like domain-containing protein [Pelagovum pacificum]|uniref:Transcriptional regulator n=1 Tax=Pelagovum pacificum TaxID=2588711 RepID=A0A5C5GB12_9RHOB|nr:cupin-like domain-containing protein [Pelagovum pacificum]QQA41258.1 cupin-like domain-containing protein [Pelagovum pacificum]TNY31933.1 transcriptional regulator [Pelagovum pacificum]